VWVAGRIDNKAYKIRNQALEIKHNTEEIPRRIQGPKVEGHPDTSRENPKVLMNSRRKKMVSKRLR